MNGKNIIDKELAIMNCGNSSASVQNKIWSQTI